MPSAALVISFDFEMAWGLRRDARDSSPFSGVERVRDVVIRLLEIFERYGISATWATIGQLMVRPGDCVDGRYPVDWPTPRYDWFRGHWLEGVPRIDDLRAPEFYAPDLIDRLVNCRVYQEIGAHTFTHVMVGHPACTEQIARAEFKACQQLAEKWGRRARSVVFPWNRCGHLRVLEETGYTCYRAINSEWYWLGRPEKLGTPLGQTAFWRAARKLVLPLRYLDERLRLTPPLPPARRVGRLWEIPHSMFFPGLRGVSKYISPEARVERARKGLEAAVQRGRIFSLYTHPENFLPDPAPLLNAFERILSYAAELRDRGVLEILSMERVAEELEAGRRPEWLSAA